MLLLQHGASVDATTKDLYTPLHIAAKEGQEEVMVLKVLSILFTQSNQVILPTVSVAQVASVLLENSASLTATTKKGFTPLHLAAKYGNMNVARLLLQKNAPVDAQGKVNSVFNKSNFSIIQKCFFFSTCNMVLISERSNPSSRSVSLWSSERSFTFTR